MNRRPLEMERICLALAAFLREYRCDVFVVDDIDASEFGFAATHPPGKCIVVLRSFSMSDVGSVVNCSESMMGGRLPLEGSAGHPRG